MALPTNVLQQVQTYQDGALAYLQNLTCFVATANTRFKDFENLEANLGSTVTFDLPPRYVTTNTLVAVFQQSQQRVQQLTVDQAVNTAYAFSSQQFIFNVREYMEKFGKSAVMELGSNVEANVALNAISGVINNDSTSPAFGTPDAYSGPFRFYGNGLTAIDSFGSLAQMLANFRNFGAAKDRIKVYLPDTIVPQIVNTGLNQFVLDRNEELANSWMVGNWMNVDFYQSNLLPQQIAGDIGNSNIPVPGVSPTNPYVMTLVSTDDPTGNNVTQLTFTVAQQMAPNNPLNSDPNAIAYGDLMQFLDGVSGQPNMRYLTFIGHVPSSQPVQFRATAAAGTNGASQITVDIYPPLVWASGNPNQNLNNALAAGMQVGVLPSHRAGLIVGGDALFLAMPKLPEEVPFPTANESDPDTGVAMRMYYGSLFGQNQRGFVHDIIWGSSLVPEYSMRIAFSLTQ